MALVSRSVLVGRLITVFALLGVAALVVLSPVSKMGLSGAEATFCLGFILLFAYYLARILRDFRLPVISSYIFAGVVAGPYIFDLLSVEIVSRLQLFDDMALAIIALLAGGEMKVRVIREKMSAFTSVIAAQILLSFVGAFLVVLLARGSMPFLGTGGLGLVLAVSLLFGLVTAARSPATTMGVIAETRSRGPLTELLLGVTVILDVVVLVLVALILPLSRAISDPAMPFSLGFARDLAIEVFGSIGAGLFFGLIIGSYMKWIRGYLPLFLVGIGFVGSSLCRHYHLEPLLAFMIAGFVLENYTAMGHGLIEALERSAYPVYVIFFAISGASINLDALRVMWALALVLVAMRSIAFLGGTMLAGRLVATVRPYSRSMWLGFLPQAGVTIGIASLVGRRFPWGDEVRTIILAVVALNQLIGPIALKFLLEAKGEAGRMDMAESETA